MQLLREGHSFSGRERNCAFLNCGPNTRFANVSAITGLDFPDDGRVVAMVDWDHDGDLDVWLHNRTGPRLRLMQNQTIQPSNASKTADMASNFVSVRLRGALGNRDAIGARVEVLFKNPDTPRLIRTLYAGDAYLSQSSKWLHFGLATKEQSNIRALRVTWPGGAIEEFSQIDPGGRFLIVEGSGRARRNDERRKVARASAEQQPLVQDNSARVMLFSRPPLPILNVKSPMDKTSHRLEFSSRPTLMVLWASWCSTCRRELQGLSEQQNEFDVIAVAVDDAAKTKPAENPLPAIISQWQLPFPVVSATHEMLDKLELIERVALNRQTPLAVPTSYLIDDTGQLAAVYRGHIEMAQLVTDVTMLEANVLERRDRAIPLKGKWTTPPKHLLIRPVAKIFRERGYMEDYARYLKIETDRWQVRRASAKTEEERSQLDRQFANDNFSIAYTHEQARDFADAVDYYRQGLTVASDDARAWLRLAHCLQSSGNAEEAIRELRSGAAQADPAPELQIELAKLLRLENDFAGAEQHIRAAIAMDPSSATAHFHLGTLLAGQGDASGAEQAFRAAVAAAPDHFESLLNLGALLASRGETTEAIDVLQQATRLEPANIKAKLNLARAFQLSGDQQAWERELRAALLLESENAQVHLGLAQLAFATERPAQAADHLSAAVRLDPNDAASKLRLAWLLATSANENVRDGARALSIATQLNQDAQGKHPLILDTLAAAYAAVGDFEAAQVAVQQAVEILDSANQIEMSQEVRRRAEQYENGRPFVQ